MLRKFVHVFISVRVQVALLIRLRHWIYRKRFLGRGVLLQWVRYLLHIISGCDFSVGAQIPASTKFPHPTGIVIGEGVVFMEGVTIFQNTTFGSHGRRGERQAYPHLEGGATVYAGAVVIGGVVLGEGCIVGANSVVLNSVPQGSSVKGNPAK